MCDCEEREFIQSQIEKYGYTFVSALNEDGDYCGYCYTVGLTAKGHPELILYLEDFRAAMFILNSYACQVYNNNKDLLALKKKNVLTGLVRDGARVGCYKVKKNFLKILPWVQERYGPGKFTALQITIPDPNGKLHNEKGCDINWIICSGQNIRLF